MKKNTWVFYFFILIFTALLSAHLVWQFTPIKGEINAALQERLKPYFGGTFAMSDFSLGFGYMSFYNIVLGSEHENYRINLDEIQIGYSIHKLPFNEMDPLRVIESITFKNPHLIVLTEYNEKIPPQRADSLDVSEILTGIQRLAEIDRVLIQNGQILWGKNPDRLTRLVSDLTGYFIIQSDTLAHLNLRGALFESSSKDLSLTGEINLLQNAWKAKALIQKSHIEESIPFLNSTNFTLKKADIEGQINLKNSSFRIRDVIFDGKIQVENMFALLFGQELQIDPFDLLFQDQRMNLSDVSGSVEDGRLTLNGNLGEVLKPKLNFTVNFVNYSAKNIAISAPILKELNQGELQGNLVLDGFPSDLTISGTVYSSKLYYNIAPFYRTSLDFVYEDKLWQFNEIKSHAAGMDHLGKGHINFNEMQMKFNLHSKRQLDSDAVPLFDKLNASTMSYSSTVFGDFPTVTFTGKIRAAIHKEPDSLLTAHFNYELIDDFLRIQSTKTAPDTFTIFSEIEQLWSDPTFKILEIKKLPFVELGSSESFKWLNQVGTCDTYFSGPVNFPSTKINFKKRKDEETIFSFRGNAIKLIEADRKLKGQFNFHTSPEQIRGGIIVENQPEQLSVHLEVPSLLEGKINLGEEENAPINGYLKILEANLKDYIGGFPAIKKSLTEGLVSGTLDISGSLDDPKINFGLEGENFLINQNGYYTMLLQGVLAHRELKFEEANVLYNNHPIIDAQFQWNISTDLLTASFKGKDIESNFIAATLFQDPTLITGDLDYEVTLGGSFRQPEIHGIVSMEKGTIKERKFDHLFIEFQDSIPDPGNLFSFQTHILNIYEFTYEDQNNLSVKISGQFPVDADIPLALSLSAEGNILTELPNFLPYFRNPACLGELSIKISGTRENPKISAADIHIFNGSLQFESVIPPVTNLVADIELSEGTQYINIKNLAGEISGHKLRIFNVPTVKTALDSLPSWYFEDFGLNFGILVLETSESGIPLSIPGLMNPGDIGLFAASGRTAEEKFYFSGPADQPRARGTITLLESRVTFPFLTIDDEQALDEENKVLDFLMGINWDVKTEAGIGNRYFVDIPAMIGQVYLDLNIDNVSDGLIFTGRLSDETFRVEGSVESTRGRVEYLDVNFKVERFGVIFNKFELFPEVYGRAYTTVRDSTNFPRDIFLVLYAVNPETNQEVSRGRWEDFRFKLVSSDPTIGETQENVLAYLGYSVDNISSKAGEVGLTLTENFLVRPLIRPLERKMERGLGLDYVRLNLYIASNLLYYGFPSRWRFLQEAAYIGQRYNNRFDPAFLLLRSSEITVGKYLIQNLYLTYTGQLVSVYEESKFGLSHRFGLEYRLLQNLLLELEFDRYVLDSRLYDKNALQDFRIRLKHSFNF